MEQIAWIVLRVVYAAMYLYPLHALLKDWKGAVSISALIWPYQPRIGAVAMLVVMIYGALSILFGFYVAIAGALLLIYNLLGVVVHYRLADQIKGSRLSSHANSSDQEILARVKGLGVLGHVTSGQKNVVLAAVAFFFMWMGSGPWSLT